MPVRHEFVEGLIEICDKHEFRGDVKASAKGAMQFIEPIYREQESHEDENHPAAVPDMLKARSHPKTCFRGENEQFCRLARSENDTYLENILSSPDAARRQKGRSQQKLGFWDGF